MKDRGKHLETLLVIATGMTAFYFFTKREEFLYVGLGLGVIGLAVPVAGKYVHLGWMGLAKAMGFVNSHIILAVVFFVILTPLALLRRISSKDPLQLRKRSDKSYFVEKEHLYEPRDLENPW